MWAQRYCRGFRRDSQLAYFHHPSCTHWKNYTGSKNTPVTSNPHDYTGRVSCCNIARHFLLFPLKKDKCKDATTLLISRVVFTGTWKWPKSVLLPKKGVVPPPCLLCQHQVLISNPVLLKRQQVLVCHSFRWARFQYDRLPGWLPKQPQCPEEERGAQGQAGLFGERLTEAGALCPTTNPSAVCLAPLFTPLSCTNWHQGCAGRQTELWFTLSLLSGRKDQAGHSQPPTQHNLLSWIWLFFCMTPNRSVHTDHVFP